MTVTTERPPAKKKRGQESVGDMVRSLGLILAGVLVLWFLAQPPSSDSKSIRVVDPSGDVASLQQAAPGVPVPGGLPDGWRATSSTLDPAGLRIGYVTPTGEYAEYVASLATPAGFLEDITGKGAQVGTLPVAGTPWQQWSDGDDHTTLVRPVGAATVVVGGVRETTSLDELEQLAAAVR